MNKRGKIILPELLEIYVSESNFLNGPRIITLLNFI